MTTQYCSSRRTKCQPLEFDPLFEIGRKRKILWNLQPILRRSLLDFESKVTSIPIFFPPRKNTMTSSSGASGPTSSQD
jgi:hypothetical protein